MLSDNGIANADTQHDGISNAVERWSEREQSQFLTLNFGKAERGNFRSSESRTMLASVMPSRDESHQPKAGKPRKQIICINRGRDAHQSCE